MPKSETAITLSFQNKDYTISPDFNLIREIENEMGGIPALLERFSAQGWKISELVALTQMMLHAAGETVDYLLLGNLMLKDGLERYLLSALSFLRLVVRSGLSFKGISDDAKTF